MHVRVCVECGEEYRPEIAACADCGGQLEDRHEDGDRTVLPSARPAAGEPGPDAAFTETISEAKAATDLEPEADLLIEAGIQVRVRPVPEGGYRLLVTAADLEHALAVLGLLAPEGDASAEETNRSCPACAVAVPPGAAECPECGLALGDSPD
jgi:hypothetical protein